MSGKPAPPVGRPCVCGHYPTSHMAVRAAAPGGLGAFILEPVGPCTRCGGACAQYRPST